MTAEQIAEQQVWAAWAAAGAAAQSVVPPGLWTLLLASAALMGSPGPSTISVTAVGAAYGLRRSLGYVFGLILGTTAVLLAVATGVFALVLSVPRLAPVLTAVSAAYVVHLAVRIARAPPLSREAPTAPAPSLGGGLLLAAANPKAYLAIAAVFAGSRLEGLPPAAEAAVKTAVLAGMIVLIHLGWLLAGAALARARAARPSGVAGRQPRSGRDPGGRKRDRHTGVMTCSVGPPRCRHAPAPDPFAPGVLGMTTDVRPSSIRALATWAAAPASGGTAQDPRAAATRRRPGCA